MASLEEIRRELDKDELNYRALSLQFGEAAMPYLKSLVAEDQPRLAPKAAFLAGVIGGESSHEVVALAARSRHDVVRVAAASALARLPASRAVEIAETLLKDADAGVRVRAAKSAGKLGSVALRVRLREMAAHDPVLHVRTLATEMSEIPRDQESAQETPNLDTTDGSGASKMNGQDMTEGAAQGRMPGVEMTEDATQPKMLSEGKSEDSHRMTSQDMTEGAAVGTMPGADVMDSAYTNKMRNVDFPDDSGASKKSNQDMTEGAASGRMPGVDKTEGTTSAMPGNDMPEGDVVGTMSLQDLSQAAAAGKSRRKRTN